MNNSDQDLWNRVRERLKSNVGDDIFNSWFARMELEAIEGDTVRLSVPTRFLKSWVQSHYADRLLACWQEEAADDHADRADGAVGGAQAAASEAEGAGSRAVRQRQAGDQDRHGDAARGGADFGRA